MIFAPDRYFVRVDYFLLAKRLVIFAIQNQISMQKSKKHIIETENETILSSSENPSENKKYIDKLDLQRSILNKLIGVDLKHNTDNNIIQIEGNPKTQINK